MPLFSRRFVRKRAISFATSLSVMATSFALAQDPEHHHHARTAKDTDEHQFLFDRDIAMSNMNRSMLMTPTGYIDRDFVDVMVPHHHQGAIDMVRAQRREDHNDKLRQLAQGFASKQEQEISIMQHALPAIAGALPSSSADATPHPAD